MEIYLIIGEMNYIKNSFQILFRRSNARSNQINQDKKGHRRVRARKNDEDRFPPHYVSFDWLIDLSFFIYFFGVDHMTYLITNT